MKRLLLLLPLLLSGVPLSALAQPEADQQSSAFGSQGSVWLLMRDGYQDSTAFEKIEMQDFDQCEMQGALYVSSERLYRTNERRGFECIEGK